MSTATQTSIEAFHRLTPDDLSRMQRDVYEVISKHGPMTTRQLGKRLNIQNSTLSPRVKELRAMGMIRQHSHAPDPDSGVSVSWWEAVQ